MLFVIGLGLGTASVAWWFEANQVSEHRFEWSPEGLWVTRGKGRWLVKNPRPTQWHPFRTKPHARPLLRYGRGLRSYLFDPRMIEEDV
jgi:hypothetical protein